MNGEKIVGGCAECVVKKAAVALLVLAVLFALWYYLRVNGMPKITPSENMCGGSDQLCTCSGNETFSPAYNPSVLDDSRLTQVAVGY